MKALLKKLLYANAAKEFVRFLLTLKIGRIFLRRMINFLPESRAKWQLKNKLYDQDRKSDSICTLQNTNAAWNGLGFLLSNLEEKHADIDGAFYILAPYGSLDVYMICMFMEEFSKKRGIEMCKIHLVTQRENYNVVKMYQYLGFQTLIVKKDFVLKSFVGDLRNSASANYLIPHPAHYEDQFRLEKIVIDGGICDENIYSIIMTNEVKSAKSTPEIAISNVGLYYKNNIKNKARKCALIMPTSNSMPTFEPEIWCALAEQLHEKGYDLYATSKIKRGSATFDYELLNIEVQQLICLANEFDVIISAQCGLINIILENSIKQNIIIINNSPEYINLSVADKIIENRWPYFYPNKVFVNPKLVINLFFCGRVDLLLDELSCIYPKLVAIERVVGFTSLVRTTTSAGDLVDRLSILNIKMSRFNGKKYIDSRMEYDLLRDMLYSQKIFDKMVAYESLLRVNLEAWELNDFIYSADKDEVDNERLINLGRVIAKAQFLNKERVKYKNLITQEINGDNMIENKSFN